MIYKITFHVSTLYIYQFSLTQELTTLQDMKKRKEENLIHDFIQETSYTQMETKYCIMGSINEDKQ